MYPVNDDNSNIAWIQFPVKYYLNYEYKKVLSIDFSKLSNYIKLADVTIDNLKGTFGLKNDNTSDKLHHRNIDQLILKGEYQSKKKIAEEVKLSDSYVCRLLKNKK